MSEPTGLPPELDWRQLPCVREAVLLLDSRLGTGDGDIGEAERVVADLEAVAVRVSAECVRLRECVSAEVPGLRRALSASADGWTRAVRRLEEEEASVRARLEETTSRVQVAKDTVRGARKLQLSAAAEIEERLKELVRGRAKVVQELNAVVGQRTEARAALAWVEELRDVLQVKEEEEKAGSRLLEREARALLERDRLEGLEELMDACVRVQSCWVDIRRAERVLPKVNAVIEAIVAAFWKSVR